MADTVKVWEMDDPPRATKSDRAQVAAFHRAEWYVYADDEAEPIRRDSPICFACREPWGAQGCSTMRVLGALALAEYRNDEAEAWLTHARKALSVAGVRGYFERRRAQGGLLAVALEFTAEVLRYGGIDCIDYKYHDLRKEIEKAITPPEDPMLTLARDVNRVAADRVRAGFEPFAPDSFFGMQTPIPRDDR